MGIESFADSGSDIGSDVQEVPDSDVDFGDGDGVNEFDEDYNEMKMEDGAPFEFDEEISEETSEGRGEQEQELSPSEAVEQELEDFDDSEASKEVAAEQIQPQETEQNPEEASLDPSKQAEDMLSDFDDETEEESYNGNVAEGENVQADEKNEVAAESETNEESEKTAHFENVSYNQGQNDFGALGTCGPTSIANSLNRVTDTSDFTENDVLHNAMENELCSKSDDPYEMGGTTTREVVSIIDNVKGEGSDIHTEVYEYDEALSVDELADRTDDPGTVAMVGVDSATLWDTRGDISCSGLFQHTDTPSDHWITVDSPIKDSEGKIAGFNIIDSGGGVEEVSRDKFEAMYVGDAEQTVSDPTAVIISKSGESGETYAASEGVERISNYKGSDMESDGRDPNVESTELKSAFSRDNFKPENTYDATCSKEFSDLKNKNVMEISSMGTEESEIKRAVNGEVYTPEEISKLKEAREKIENPKSDTIMQKVAAVDTGEIEKDLKAYLNPTVWDSDLKVDTGVPCDCKIYGFVSKAEDTAPYTTTPEQCYETLRLDYEGTQYTNPNQSVYVVRYIGDTGQYEIPYSKEFGGHRSDGQPFTGNGYTGSPEYVVPEYVSSGTTPTAGEIYRVNPDGTEEAVAYYASREKVFELYD